MVFIMYMTRKSTLSPYQINKNTSLVEHFNMMSRKRPNTVSALVWQRYCWLPHSKSNSSDEGDDDESNAFPSLADAIHFFLINRIMPQSSHLLHITKLEWCRTLGDTIWSWAEHVSQRLLYGRGYFYPFTIGWLSATHPVSIHRGRKNEP